MIKALAVDLDDTLARDDHNISKENIEAIHRLNEQGVMVIINSGRCEAAIRRHVEELELKDHMHVAINGAMILDYKSNHRIVKPFRQSDYEYLVKRLKRQKREVMVYSEDNLIYEYAPNLYETTGGYQGKHNVEKGDVLKVENCPRLCTYHSDEDDLAYLRSICPKGYWTTANSHVVDYMPNGVNKWTGLEEVLKQYGIDKKDVWCVGDQESDLEMFKNCAKSFAVNNCDELARKQADVVLPRSNMENGVAYLIYKYILEDEEALKII